MKWGRTMLTEIKRAGIHSAALQDAQPAAGTAYQHRSWAATAAPRSGSANWSHLPNKQAYTNAYPF